MAKIHKIIIVCLVFILTPLITRAASLSVNPASGTFSVGDHITVHIVVSSSQSLNAVSGTIMVPTSSFAIDSVSKTGSILNFWVTEPVVSKSSGTVRFEGVSLGGFSGSGNVLTLVIHPISPGGGTISLDSVQILANDGQGTDITKTLGKAEFSIGPAKIVPTKAPESKKVIPSPSPDAEVLPVVEVPQSSTVINAPEIMLGAKFGEPAIIGSSEYPKSQVLVTFVDNEGSKIFITGNTADDGSFVTLVPRALRGGAYTVSAVAILSDGTQSISSHEIVITTGTVFDTIDWKIKLLIGILVLVIVVFLTKKLMAKRSNSSASVKQAVHSAETVVRKSFGLLREDVSDFAKGKALPDRKKVSEIKKELDDAEDVITKEIKEIE